MCLNNCSGNGVCEAGVCKCTANFKGRDCSIDKTKPAQIGGLSVGQTCDIKGTGCSSIIINGNGFIVTEIIVVYLFVLEVNWLRTY